jgi:hypothetical protein
MKKKPSFKKIEANRANALRSTGPKSQSGKKKSSGNAVKHGAYATNMLIEGEDKELYEAIKKEQRQRYSPASYIEKALVDQLVNELWNLRRITQAEQFFQADVQSDLLKVRNDLTESEIKLLQEITDHPKRTSRRFAEAAQPERLPPEERTLDDEQYKNAKAQLAIFNGLAAKAPRLGEVYADVFLHGSRERMEKIMSLRRHCLQHILGIERELEGRLSSRKTLN